MSKQKNKSDFNAMNMVELCRNVEFVKWGWQACTTPTLVFKVACVTGANGDREED